jgi:hypothetical protein
MQYRTKTVHEDYALTPETTHGIMKGYYLFMEKISL